MPFLALNSGPLDQYHQKNIFLKNVSIEQENKCTDKAGFAALVSRTCIRQCNSTMTRLPIGGLNLNWNWEGNESCGTTLKHCEKEHLFSLLILFEHQAFSSLSLPWEAKKLLMFEVMEAILNT